MTVLVKLVVVCGLGALELWAAIPAGLALRLHPVATAIAAGVGAVLGVLAVFGLGEGARKWLVRRHSGDRERGRVHRLWTRYGVPGQGLTAPLLLGTLLGTAVCLALGAPRRALLLWTTVGIAFWATLLTIGGVLGFAGFDALRP